MKRKCEICGEKKTTIIFKQKFILPTKNYFHPGYSVSVCKECNFAFADGIPDQKYIDNYYRDMSKKTSLIKRTIKFDKKLHLDFLNKQYEVSKKNILKYLKTSDRVLDVGCYTGNLLFLLKENGFKKTEGLDTSKYAAKIGKEQFNLNIHVGSVFDDLNIGKFDFIILTHVMEHVKDLDVFVKKIYELLNEGGKAYIEVPDAHNFFIPDDNDNRYSNDQKEPFLQFSVEHINYFSKNSLTNLMINRGFGVISVNSQLSHIAVISSIWEKNGLIKDDLIVKSLKKYVTDSNHKLKKTKRTINKVMSEKKEVYVWGAGLHTQKLLAITNLKKLKIRSFIDIDPYYSGGKLINKPIINPNKIDNDINIPIIISSKAFQEEIIGQIKKMKLKNRIITLY